MRVMSKRSKRNGLVIPEMLTYNYYFLAKVEQKIIKKDCFEYSKNDILSQQMICSGAVDRIEPCYVQIDFLETFQKSNKKTESCQDG
jgi:hypothetical protein